MKNIILFSALLALLSNCRKPILSDNSAFKNLQKSFNLQTTINSTDQIIEDMISCGEATPSGVPNNYDWYRCPRLSAGNNPRNLKAVIPWGMIYETTEGNGSINTRVKIRNLVLYYLSKSKKTWIQVDSTSDVYGAFYVEDFVNNDNIPASSMRHDSDRTTSIKLTKNYNFHFWPAQGRKYFNTSDIEGWWASCEAKLIIDDVTKPDDREKAKFILAMGSDYWLNLTIDWDAEWVNSTDIGIGRFKYITKNWRAFNMHSVTKEQLIKLPPPYN